MVIISKQRTTIQRNDFQQIHDYDTSGVQGIEIPKCETGNLLALPFIDRFKLSKLFVLQIILYKGTSTTSTNITDQEMISLSHEKEVDG